MRRINFYLKVLILIICISIFCTSLCFAGVQDGGGQNPSDGGNTSIGNASGIETTHSDSSGNKSYESGGGLFSFAVNTAGDIVFASAVAKAKPTSSVYYSTRGWFIHMKTYEGNAGASTLNTAHAS